MKPSEYLSKRGLITNHKELIKDRKTDYMKLKGINKFIIDEFEKTLFKTYENLDKRFIDRKELKNKINEIDIWNKNGLKVKKEILELIDK